MNEKEISVILTADEELKIMSGDNVWFTRAEPKIELEKLTLRDGPHGVRDGSPSFLYPNINLLACSWDRELLYRVGEYLGRDAKKKGVNVLLVSKMSHIFMDSFYCCIRKLLNKYMFEYIIKV